MHVSCKYCGKNAEEIYEHPYPSKRIHIKTNTVLEVVRKYLCEKCGFYMEEYRHTSDIGIPGNLYYVQKYRYGMYNYKKKDFETKEIKE